MDTEFVLMGFFILIGILSAIYLKVRRKKLEEVGFLENGINHKLLFGTNVKIDIHIVDMKLDKFKEVMNLLGNIQFRVAEINYWYLINDKNETLGATFLIREEDEACQIEMKYDDYLKVISEILKITEEKDVQIGIEKYFYKISKNVSLISIQFKDMLLKLGADYEEIVGL